jgi:hypothetical protein
VLTASVILFVLVTSGNGDTTENGTAAAGSEIDSEEGNTTDSHKNGSNIISSVFEDLMAVNLIDIFPNPIKSFLSLVSEIYYIMNKLGPRLPELIFNPVSLILTIFPYFVSVVLIALTFNPFFILPIKIIALFLSIVGLFTDLFAPLDKDFLSKL